MVMASLTLGGFAGYSHDRAQHLIYTLFGRVGLAAEASAASQACEMAALCHKLGTASKDCVSPSAHVVLLPLSFP